MSRNYRRTALLGAGLISALALLALVSGHDELVEQDPEADAMLPPSQQDARVSKLMSSPIGVQTAAAPAAVQHEAYLSDRIMIRPRDLGDAAKIAADHGGSLFRKPGRSGWVAISLRAGSQVGSAVEALRADSRVAQAGPVGVVRGAAPPGPAAGSPAAIQQVALFAMKAQKDLAWSSITVAVIDSGVAYEDYVDGDVTYAQAATLADTTFRDAYDFVNDDSHANDDHMHGTHMASIIASQPQYTDDMQGFAPGVSLMPIKVLDATNTGNEIDLIDGLWHAIDNEADIINLSLAFGESYVPSAALQQALRAAHTAGIVLVAASGNDATDRLAWPAASPYVIGVASACPDKGLSGYSNTSPAVHVSGVGGCMDVDTNADGYPDGLLGETIIPTDPSQTQMVLWAGTSQAAATVSAMAARALSDDAGSPERVSATLQYTSFDLDDSDRFDGVGAGIPQRPINKDFTNAAPAGEYLVAILPYLHDAGTDLGKPAAVVHVLDSAGDPASGGDIWLTMRGSTDQTVKCALSTDGACHFIGSESVSLVDGDGAAAALGWSIEVDAYVVSDVNQVMEPAMFASDGLEVLVAAMGDNSDLDGVPLGIYWPDGATPTSSVTTAESYAFVNSGVGFASSPLGVLLTPGNFPTSALTTTTVDLDGTGFSSSPLGTMSLTLITFGGTGFSSSPLGGVGFSSSPLGLSSFTLAVMDGVGFSSSPLGLDAFDLYAPGGTTIDLAGVGFSSSPLGGVGFSSSPLNLATGGVLGVSTVGTETGDLLDAGGWTIGDGSYAIGTGLIGATMVDTTPTVLGKAYGDGWEVCD